MNNKVNFAYMSQLISKTNINDSPQYQKTNLKINNTNQPQMEYLNSNLNQRMIDDKNYETQYKKCNCNCNKETENKDNRTINSNTPASVYLKWKADTLTPSITNSTIYNKKDNNSSQSINDSYEDKPKPDKSTLKLMSYTPNSNYRISNNDNPSSYSSYTGYFNESYKINNNDKDKDISTYYSAKTKEINRELNNKNRNNIDSINLNNSMHITDNNQYSSHMVEDNKRNLNYNTIPKENMELHKQNNNEYKYESQYSNLNKRELKATSPWDNISKENSNQTISRGEYSYHTPIQTKIPFQNYSQYFALNKTEGIINKHDTLFNNEHFQSATNSDINQYNSSYLVNNSNSKEYPLYQNYHNKLNERNANTINNNERINYHIRNDNISNFNTNKSIYFHPINNYMPSNLKNNNINANNAKENIGYHYSNLNNTNDYQRNHQSSFDYPSSNTSGQASYYSQIPIYNPKSNTQQLTDSNEDSSNHTEHNISSVLRTPLRQYAKQNDDQHQNKFDIHQDHHFQSQQEKELLCSKSVDRIKHYDSPIFQYYRGNTKNTQQAQSIYLQERENNLSFSRINNDYNQSKQTQPQAQAQYKEYIPYKRLYSHIQKINK